MFPTDWGYGDDPDQILIQALWRPGVAGVAKAQGKRSVFSCLREPAFYARKSAR